MNFCLFTSLLLAVLYCNCATEAQSVDDGWLSCNTLETAVNNYRRSTGRAALRCHDKPRYLAQRHAYDNYQAKKDGTSHYCDNKGHAWRSNYYTCDQGPVCSGLDWKIAACHLGQWFVDKIQQGAEIYTPQYPLDAKINDAESAVDSWKGSSRHNDAMLSTRDMFGCGSFDGKNYCVFYDLF